MLLDTSGLFCLHARSELFHAPACDWYDSAAVRLTHNYVLAEFIALAHSRRLSRIAALEFHDALSLSPEVEVVWVDPALHLEATNLLHARLDKSYSLCDAVSFVLMRHRGIQDALTTDHHFDQEGFRRLLK